ncbi:MAG: hypothetical protein NXI22_25740, partial [bacterium]|nr:hypothetical protein [bacterium]
DLKISKTIGNLSTAATKLRKNSRDAPQMVEQLGELPTIGEVAKAVVESSRIIIGSDLMLRLLRGEANASRSPMNPKVDPWGIGLEYSPHLLTALSPPTPTMRIATHKDPDADALVSAWMAQRYLFPGQSPSVEFVARDYESDRSEFDCVVDVGRKHDPRTLQFDHKPPAFKHRDQECATSLVWEHARSGNADVGHLRELVELIHDGDAATRRSKSDAYKASRTNGLHALIKHAKAYAQGDRMLYQAVGVFLDAAYC